LDKLIYYVNQRKINGSKINIFYSTTSCYLYSLYKSNITWPEKSDDFFPYAHRPHSFWTGYFTSRITFKGYVRQVSNFLQAVRHLSVFSNLKDLQTKYALDTLTRAMGIAQHHDAISGTERQHVAYDYAKRLSKGTNMCLDIIQNALTSLIFKTNIDKNFNLSNLKFYYCPLMNISECNSIENLRNISVIAYNPLGQAQSYWIRLPVTNTNYVVYDLETFEILESEFVDISTETKRIPERNSTANYEALFIVSLPPLGFKTLALLESKKYQTTVKPLINKKINSLENQKLQILFDPNGNLKTINNLDSAITSNTEQNFCYYKSMSGNNSIPELQSSGAYIFRPNGDPICFSVKEFYVTQGKQFSEINQIYNSFISQTIRLYNDANYLEFNWQVGPIDILDGNGKEIIIKFATDLNTNSLFYTDSNGREILERKRDYRPSWPNFNQTEPIAGNYYPINSRIFIRDKSDDRQLTLVTDRTHGGSSVKDGELEIMLHRRLSNDDSLGLNEPLNEIGSDRLGLIAKGKFYLFLNSTSKSARLHREMSHRVNTQPLLTFSQIKNQTDIEFIKQLNHIKILNGSLPSNVHLLTLMHDFKDQNTNTLIIRLEHFYELNEDQVLSEPVTFNLRYLFNGSFNLLNIEELSLGANMNANELIKRLKFNSDTNLKPKNSKDIQDKFQVTLNPMEIKTYRIWYQAY
jgi:lysosomal alpha-mannosidase